jgi:hypothetical protein
MAIPAAKANPSIQCDSSSIFDETIATIGTILGPALDEIMVENIRRAIGIAPVNALADCCWQRRPHSEVELCAGIDAFDATEIRKGDRGRGGRRFCSVP